MVWVVTEYMIRYYRDFSVDESVFKQRCWALSRPGEGVRITPEREKKSFKADEIINCIHTTCIKPSDLAHGLSLNAKKQVSDFLHLVKVKNISNFNTSCSVCWTGRQASGVFLETNGCNSLCQTGEMWGKSNSHYCPNCHDMIFKQAFIDCKCLTNGDNVGRLIFPNVHNMICSHLSNMQTSKSRAKVPDQWGRRGQIVFRRCLSPCNAQNVQIVRNLEKYNSWEIANHGI